MSRRLKVRPIEFLVPMTLFALVAGSGFIAGRFVDKEAERRFEGDLYQAGQLAVVELEQFMGEQERSIDHMARTVLPLELALQSDEDPINYISGFQRLGSEASAWLAGQLAMNWVGVDGEIKQVWPLDVNQLARGRSLLDHPNPAVRDAFLRAASAVRESNTACQYTPLIELYQSGLGYAVYRAVFNRRGNLVGVLNVAYRIESVLAQRVPSVDAESGASFAVMDTTGRALYSTSTEALRADWAYASDLKLPMLDETWTLRVGPTDAWRRAELSFEGPKVMAVGVLLAAFIASLAFSIGRKRAQKEEVDLRLGLALEGARLGVWDLHVPSGSLHLNDRWMTMLGYSAGEVDFDLDFYRSLVHPDDLERVREAMAMHLAGGAESYRTEHRLRAQNDEWVWVLDTGRVVERDLSGRPVRVAGTQTNITETLAAKRALRISLDRYRSIFEHSPVGMIEQDWRPIKGAFDGLKGRGVVDLFAYLVENPDVITRFLNMPVIIDANPAFLGMFGASDMHELRQNLPRMIDARAHWALARGLGDLYGNGRSCEFDVPLKALEGDDLLYSVRILVAPNSEQDFGSVFVSIVDNTRRLREEEQRRVLEARDRQVQKDESLALLAGGVAHDFNNLLVPIIGSIELALGETPRDSDVARNLRRAEQASMRAAELARQMLTYSGRGQVQSEVFDLVTLVREMTHLLASSLPGKVELGTQFCSEALEIEGDPTQLRQLVMNLVINAADAASGQQGSVVVRMGSAVPTREELEVGFLGESLAGEACIFLEVQDTGLGFDEATLKRIFEPFFSTKASGRGLGMSVVLGIVRGHGGGLIVDSRVGQGTRIRVYLPRTDQPLTVPFMSEFKDPKPTRSDKRLSGCVLFADDEPQVLGFVREALSRVGLEVECVENGAAALELWQAHPGRFDLVVLDATMPRLGGVETMDLIRAEDPDQPIVLASGYTEHEVATRAAEKPNCWFLPKPFGLNELMQIVREVFERSDAVDADSVTR